jgi:hypothetical protein
MTIKIDRVQVRQGWLQNFHINVPKQIVDVCLGSLSNAAIEFHLNEVSISTGALQRMTGHLTGVKELFERLNINDGDVNERELRIWVDDCQRDRLYVESAPLASWLIESDVPDVTRFDTEHEVFFRSPNRGVFAFVPPYNRTVVWLRNPYAVAAFRNPESEPLTADTADVLRAGVLTASASHSPTARVDDVNSDEGRRRLFIHTRRERAQGLVKAKLKSVLAPWCEVCGFSFEQCYGEAGAGFAEVHHLTPLHDTDGIRRTTLEDLAIVCANCHRMLHRKPFPSLVGLRESLRVNDSAQEPG